jgi:hypothetical protein
MQQLAGVCNDSDSGSVYAGSDCCRAPVAYRCYRLLICAKAVTSVIFVEVFVDVNSVALCAMTRDDGLLRAVLGTPKHGLTAELFTTRVRGYELGEGIISRREDG